MDILPDDLKYELLDSSLNNNNLSAIVKLCSVNKSYRDICEEYSIWKKIGKKIYLTDNLNPKFSSWRSWVLSDDKLFITDNKLKQLLTIYYNEYIDIVEQTYDQVEMISSTAQNLSTHINNRQADQLVKDGLLTLLDFYSSVTRDKIDQYIDQNMKWFKNFLLSTKKFNYIDGRYYLLNNDDFDVNLEHLFLIDNDRYNGYWFHVNIMEDPDEETSNIINLLKNENVYYIYEEINDDIHRLFNGLFSSIFS